MKALDTNVLARLLLKDDLTQFKKAQALLASDAQFTAPATVMLELVWVLESNDCSPSEICHGLGLLINLHNFKPAHEHVIRKALTAYANGLDFADALHLGLSQKEEVLLTFDKSFVKQASRMNQLPAVHMVR
jgi:predicted nucleic-acid-binding protein